MWKYQNNIYLETNGVKLSAGMDKDTYTCVITKSHAFNYCFQDFRNWDHKANMFVWKKYNIYIYYFEKDLHSTPTSVNDSLPNQGHADTLVFAWKRDWIIRYIVLGYQ